MSEHLAPEKDIRLAVISADHGAAMHVGGGVQTVVRTFALPDEIQRYIRQQRLIQYNTVTLAVEVADD